MGRKSCYDILGVPPDATPETIQTVYRERRAQLQQGQDSHSDASALQLLQMAFETLSSPASRARHDASLRSTAQALPEPQLELPLAGGAASLRAVPTKLWAWIVALLLALALVWLGVPKKLPAPVAQPAPAPAASAVVRTSAEPRVLTPAEVFARNRESVVVITGNLPEGGRIQGSGVAIAPEAVITNCHVANAADALQVMFKGREYNASLRYRDTGRDLCQLQVNGLPTESAEIAPLDSVAVGARVYALGAPQGLDTTLSEGLVSGLRPYFESSLIQTSAAISPGSSGGGLYDQQGRLIGITTFQAATGQNLNFAVPAEWISALPDRNGNSDRFPDPAGFH
ncbi:trypsin-like peptidase domain-containing protein [Niveibacterium sp. SC-1]|uniref:trypsin-like peptidase domain-containing protein n=1 Tax=Niveibacterium sp. SC-1 TaxID=3135646 RepID=UPI00311FA9CD